MRILRLATRIAGPLYGTPNEKLVPLLKEAVGKNFSGWSVQNRTLGKLILVTAKKEDREVIFELQNVGKSGEPTVRVSFYEQGIHTFTHPTLRKESKDLLRRIQETVSDLGDLGFYVEYTPSEVAAVSNEESRYSPSRESIYYKAMNRAGMEPYDYENNPLGGVSQFSWGKYPHSDTEKVNQKKLYDAFMSARKLLIAESPKGFEHALWSAADQMAYDLGIKYEEILRTPWYRKLKRVAEGLKEFSLNEERMVRPKNRTSTRNYQSLTASFRLAGVHFSVT